MQPFLYPVTFSKVLAGLKISCGRAFGPRLAKFIMKLTHSAQNLVQPGPCLAKFIVKWTHFGQNMVQPFLSPVTFSKVLAGLKISCGRGFGPRLAKFFAKWTHSAQNLAQPFLPPVTFSKVLAGPPVTFSDVFSYLGDPGGSREPLKLY